MVVIAGVCVLVWVSSIRVPKLLGSIVAGLAASSLYIYLTHWQVYPHLRDDHAVLAVFASLVVGVTYSRVMHPLTTRVSARITDRLPDAPARGDVRRGAPRRASRG